MFEKYNDYLAVQYSSSGEKTAVFNTKLCRSLRLPLVDGKSEYMENPTVLVYPVTASKEEVHALWKKAWNAGYSLRRSISEPEAVVSFYRIQNKEAVKTGLVNVVDIHKDRTDITLVNVEENRNTPLLHKTVMVGGERLTLKMVEYYMKKLKRVKGDITGHALSVQKLHEMAEDAKIRMSRHRLAKDEFIFRSPRDGICYLLRIFREDYDRMVKEILKEIFYHVRKQQEQCKDQGYGEPGVILLSGGMSEYKGCIEMIKEWYAPVPVVAYKGHEAAVLGAALYMV